MEEYLRNEANFSETEVEEQIQRIRNIISSNQY